MEKLSIAIYTEVDLLNASAHYRFKSSLLMGRGVNPFVLAILQPR